MTESFTELEIVADDQLQQHLIGIMSQLGFEGFWEDDASLRCYIRSGRWSPAMLTEVETIVRSVVRSSGSVTPRISLRTLENRNWNEEWEKTIRPIHVTDRIVVTPSWHRYTEKPGEIVLIIDPKMSFGTGYHETTRLILRLLEKHLSPESKVLDVGTGTGILAIAAIKLGAASAVALDNDEWSHANAIENVRLNSAERFVTIARGEISSLPMQLFDMIVVNIQRNVIQTILPEMKNRLIAGGIILLSGLLSSERESITISLKELGLTVREELAENEWIALSAS